MKSIKLEVQKREGTGKSFVKKRRQKGYVPGIVYGPELAPWLFEAEYGNIKHVLKRIADEIMLVNIDLDGKEVHTIIKEVQRHPVTGRIIHIDLEQISLKKSITVKLPVEFVGEAQGVEKGGVLTPHMRTLTVKGLVKDIPEDIKIDVSELDFNDSIHVKDVELPGLEKLNDPQESIVSVVMPKGIEEEKEKVAEEVAEGEEAAVTPEEEAAEEKPKE